MMRNVRRELSKRSNLKVFQMAKNKLQPRDEKQRPPRELNEDPKTGRRETHPTGRTGKTKKPLPPQKLRSHFKRTE
ncbi:hypothetical protein V6N13_089423 [Hibiscus sabdariffa]